METDAGQFRAILPVIYPAVVQADRQRGAVRINFRPIFVHHSNLSLHGRKKEGFLASFFIGDNNPSAVVWMLAKRGRLPNSSRRKPEHWGPIFLNE
ncbi:MAG TPA: hypothetical protein VNO70_03730 [Blastocatellia bacterium]|nr:hypothetical protein [Blastocatellia bacterium]